MSFRNEEDEETENDSGMLLNLSQKSSIFVGKRAEPLLRLFIHTDIEANESFHPFLISRSNSYSNEAY